MPPTEWEAALAQQPDAPALPPWARGFSIAQLQAIAALYAQHRTGLTFGAFSRIRERDVAAWLADGTLHTYTELFGDPVGAIRARTLNHSLTVRDFTHQAVLRAPAGTLHLSDMAAAPRYSYYTGQVAAWARLHPGPVLAEAYIENDVERNAMDAAGLEHLATKVRASSELIGVYGRGIKRLAEPLPQEGFGLRQLLELNWQPLLPPLEAAVRHLDDWAMHYSTYNVRGTWQAMALRGYSADPAFIIKPAEMARAWRTANHETLGWQPQDTPLRRLLPSVEPVLALLGGAPIHRLRLMRLVSGGGELRRHADTTDPDAGIADGRLLRIHFPIVTNHAVKFQQWLPTGLVQTHHLPAGTVWSLDTRLPHRAVNDGDGERIHLVADVESNPYLRHLLG